MHAAAAASTGQKKVLKVVVNEAVHIATSMLAAWLLGTKKRIIFVYSITICSANSDPNTFCSLNFKSIIILVKDTIYFLFVLKQSYVILRFYGDFNAV